MNFEWKRKEYEDFQPLITLMNADKKKRKKIKDYGLLIEEEAFLATDLTDLHGEEKIRLFLGSYKTEFKSIGYNNILLQ